MTEVGKTAGQSHNHKLSSASWPTCSSQTSQRAARPAEGTQQLRKKHAGSEPPCWEARGRKNFETSGPHSTRVKHGGSLGDDATIRTPICIDLSRPKPQCLILDPHVRLPLPASYRARAFEHDDHFGYVSREILPFARVAHAKEQTRVATMLRPWRSLVVVRRNTKQDQFL